MEFYRNIILSAKFYESRGKKKHRLKYLFFISVAKTLRKFHLERNIRSLDGRLFLRLRIVMADIIRRRAALAAY